MTSNAETSGAKRATGAAACDARLSRWDLAAAARAAVLRASVAFTPILAEVVPQAEFVQVQLPVPAGWNAYNPSIASTSRGLLMAVRSSNWEFKRHHYFRVHAEDSVARSRAYLVELDAGLQPSAATLLQDETDRTGEVASQYRGYNDLRLLEQRGQLRAVATTLDFSSTGTSQMALLDIVGNRLRNCRLLSDGFTRTEKNWSPALWYHELFFVYAFAPTTLLRWDGVRLLPAGLDAYAGPPLAADFRGGSQLVPVGPGFLTVVHAGADYPDGSRVYLHRFVSLDEEFRISGISPQFMFRERGVEFAAGMAIEGGAAIVSFGVADTECWLVRLPLDRVLGLLSPPIENDLLAHRGNIRRS